MQRNLQQQLDGFARRSPGYGSRYYIGNGRFLRLSAADIAEPDYASAKRPRADKGVGYRYIRPSKREGAGFVRVLMH
jgi:hypothetical protein